jgi:hypothetical protein
LGSTSKIAVDENTCAKTSHQAKGEEDEAKVEISSAISLAGLQHGIKQPEAVPVHDDCAAAVGVTPPLPTKRMLSD